jgi:hypothetical protein
MTRPANARAAGAAFLIYIAAGVVGLAVPIPLPLSVVLSLVMAFAALVLGVTLYAITRDEDRDVAMLAMICRVVEAVLGVVLLPLRLSLRSMAAASATTDPAAMNALEALYRAARGLNTTLGATFFAVASLLFAWLLLRGRLIPSTLAWLGVVASALLVLCLPLQLGGVLAGPVLTYMWLPMLAFEVPLAFWLLVKGVPAAR